MRATLGLWAIAILSLSLTIKPAVADDFGPRFQNESHMAFADQTAHDLQAIEPSAGPESSGFDQKYEGYIDVPDATMEQQYKLLKERAEKSDPVSL